ncbi:MAG: YceD family protein [bacterium]
MRKLGLVPLASLKSGDNRFELEGQARDFGCEVREVRENPLFEALTDRIKVVVNITRSGRRFLVQGRLRFRARLGCAFCGESYEEEYDEELVAEFTVLEPERAVFVRELEPEELDRLPIDADFIDLTQMVRDAIHLAIPIAPKCRQDCRGICPVCGANLNRVECHCPRSME